MKGRIAFNQKEGLTPGVASGTITRLIQQTIRSKYIELPVVWAGEYAKTLSVYIDKHGNMAPVPEGYTVSGIEKENTILGKDKSLVLYQIPEEQSVNWTDSEQLKSVQKCCNQLIFIPVSRLKTKATLDGANYDEKVGTSLYYDLTTKNIDHFNENAERKFYSFDGITKEYLERIKSYIKWGGFFISRYYNFLYGIDEEYLDSRNGRDITVRKVKEWEERIKKYNSQGKKTILKAAIPYGGEFDTFMSWLAESNGITYRNLIYQFMERDRRDEEYRASESIYFGYIVEYPWIDREMRYSKFVGGKPYTLNNVCDLSGVCLAWTREKVLNNFWTETYIRRDKFGLRIEDDLSNSWSYDRYAAARAIFFIG